METAAKHKREQDPIPRLAAGLFFGCQVVVCVKAENLIKILTASSFILKPSEFVVKQRNDEVDDRNEAGNCVCGRRAEPRLRFLGDKLFYF